MNIEIIGAELAEPEILTAALQRCKWWDNVKAIKIFINPRVPLDAPEYNNPGWIEYGISVEWETSKLFIGCLQRKPGEQIEFHS